MITGSRLVRLIHPVHRECYRLLSKNRDRKLMRRQALKLRFWPEKHPDTGSGELLDVDWSWIRACSGLNIGELRISDKIGGFDNWRIIFFEGPKPDDGSMPKIWVLQLMKKKRDEFTDADIKTFKLRRLMVVERYYEDGQI
jgi:hypothetical protein